MAAAVMIAPHRIIAALRAESKREVLAEFARAAAADLGIPADAVLDALSGRERLGSTGIGDGIALPHARVPQLSEIVVFFGRSPRGIPFDAVDKRPVHLFCVLLAPVTAGDGYLATLATLSRLLQRAELRAELLQTDTAEGLHRLLASNAAAS